MNTRSRARKASTSGYVQTGNGKGKITRPCPKCEAKPGWRCRMSKSMGDGITNWVPLKNFHTER